MIGADLLAEVPTWYGGAELQRTVPFIVVGRAGLRRAAAIAPVAMPAVSSSEVRARAGRRRPM